MIPLEYGLGEFQSNYVSAENSQPKSELITNSKSVISSTQTAKSRSLPKLSELYRYGNTSCRIFKGGIRN